MNRRCLPMPLPARWNAPIVAAFAGLAAFLMPLAADAAPSGGPLINFGQSILNFLTGPLAYVVFGVGVCIAAISMMMGAAKGSRRRSTP
jgi:type IV secretory pathway VirB2 component (pilin)